MGTERGPSRAPVIAFHGPIGGAGGGGSSVAVQLRPASRLATLWRQRRVLQLLVSRDLKVKYADSALGYLWSIVEPLLMAGIYWFVFTKLMTRSLGEDPYIVFLLCAMLPWQWANGVVRASMRALNKDSKLVRSTNLPREIWVLRAVLSRFADFALALPVLALFAALNGATPSWHVVFFPVAVLIQGVLLTGLGLILAPLAVLYGDVERLMRLLMRLLFFLSPVVYGVHDVQDRLGDGLSGLYVINPFAGLLDLYRTAFFAEEWAGWAPLGVSVGSAVVLLALGLVVFRRLEGPALKEI
ncbi:MAG: ABC transporter permease [Sporichthyaceae bacterium]|nr:ABC transporter permease [Sporichthyaceae bacterium]